MKIFEKEKINEALFPILFKLKYDIFSKKNETNSMNEVEDFPKNLNYGCFLTLRLTRIQSILIPFLTTLQAIF